MGPKLTEPDVSVNPFALVGVMLASILLVPFVPERIVHATVATSITPTTGTGNLGTTITQAGSSYNITGGTRPGGGPNLFHSFANFSVGSGEIANFQNTMVNGSFPFTSNILGRVTGGNISNIFGTIQTTNFGNANLFLMNPAGFLFGPNATLNVGGMMTFTTADYMRLADGGRFNANPNTTPADVLTAAPVAAFGFLGSNPAAITFEGGQLTVSNGTGVTLVGGNITLSPDPVSGTPSGITAHGRPILLTSVAGPGEVAADTMMPAAGMALGTITLNGATLDTSGDLSSGDGSGGAISIRGGQLVATGATILTSPAFGSTGQGGGVSITVTDTASITDNSTIMTSSSSPNGDAGPVSITASHVILQDSFILSQYAGDGTTAGNGGAVTLTGTDSVTLTRSGIATDSSNSNGSGGAVSMTAPIITLEDSILFTDMQNNLPLIDTFIGGSGGAVTLNGTASVSLIRSGIDTSTSFTTGNSGPITITAPTITITDVGPLATSIDTSTHSFKMPTAGNGGDILIAGTNVTFSNSAVIQSIADSNGSFSKGGAIQITGAESILLDSATLIRTTTTSQAHAGDIQLAGKHVTITGQSIVDSETIGPGGGGTIKIVGTENLALESGSVISTNSAGAIGTEGPAGHIELDTQQLTISGGSIVRSQTFGIGLGGTVTVQGIGSPAQSVLIDGSGSGIFTDTQGTGAGGNIFVNANSVTLQNSGTLSAATSGTDVSAIGGTISVTANQVQMNNGGLMTVASTGAGTGGSISIGTGIFTSNASTVSSTATQATGGDINVLANGLVTMTNGASISASSTGAGNAGNIMINAGQNFISNNSSVTTQASQASGGTIKITTTPSGMIELTNSTISASVLDGSGGGGSVNIDPQFVVLQNSQILANAVQGPGGNIFITTNLLLPDATSVISASSQFGQNGTITIQSPISPAGGKIIPLSQQPLLATSLLSQRCAALAGGEFSSFTVAGRDSLPAEPGGWLASPLALATLSGGTGLEASGEGREGMAEEASPVGQTAILSLRRIAPPGFLTQAFAVDWSAGCTS